MTLTVQTQRPHHAPGYHAPSLCCHFLWPLGSHRSPLLRLVPRSKQAKRGEKGRAIAECPDSSGKLGCNGPPEHRAERTEIERQV